jgi:hypothetical protein
MLLVAKRRETSKKGHLIFNELHFGAEKVDQKREGGEELVPNKRTKLSLYISDVLLEVSKNKIRLK